MISTSHSKNLLQSCEVMGFIPGTPRLPFGAVMVNFTCQLDLAMGCPDSRSNVLGVSVRVFWIRLTFKRVVSEQVSLSNVDGLYLIS